MWDEILNTPPEQGAGKYAKNFLKKYPVEHHVEFKVINNWRSRQETMYKLKKMFTEDGLVNGADFLFLRVDNNEIIRVWFANPENCSFYSLKYYVD